MANSLSQDCEGPDIKLNHKGEWSSHDAKLKKVTQAWNGTMGELLNTWCKVFYPNIMPSKRQRNRRIGFDSKVFSK